MDEQSNLSEVDNKIWEEQQVLSKVIDALLKLDVEARYKILRTLMTFFEVDVQQDKSSAFIRSDRPNTRQTLREHSFTNHVKISPKEFIMEKEPETDVERVVCLSYYLAHYRDVRHFKTSDISNINTEAAQRKFANTAYVVNNATQSGYLAQAPGNSKQLSAMGEQYVEALPDRALAKSVALKSRSRRAKKKRVIGTDYD
ncbi:MAG: hypothetical protein NT072_12825 [Deltaproteobacteria bacterium]|nr:hypothetical protein [Deltaproteobacteria bacterium]